MDPNQCEMQSTALTPPQPKEPGDESSMDPNQSEMQSTASTPPQPKAPGDESSEKTEVILIATSKKGDFPTDSLESILLFVHFEIDKKYCMTLKTTQENDEGSQLILGGRAFKGLKQALDEYAFLRKDMFHDGIIASTKVLRDAVEHAFLHKDNFQGMEEAEKVLENTLREQLHEACKHLAEQLGMRKYFSEDEVPSISDAPFIGAALSACLLLDKDSWVYKTLSGYSNLLGLVERFCAQRKKDNMPRDFSHIYDQVQMVIEDAMPLPRVKSKFSRLYIYEAEEGNPLELPVGSYVFKVADDVPEPKRSKYNSPTKEHYDNWTRQSYHLTESLALHELRYEELYGWRDLHLPKGKDVLSFHFTPEDLLRANIKETLQVVEQIAYGVHMMHTHKNSGRILHNDLNTNNICLNENNDAFIIDFGYATIDDRDPPGPGTLAYGDPSKVRNWRYDVYSIGMILIRMITGQDIRTTNEGSVQERIASMFVNGQAHQLLRPRLQNECDSQTAYEVVLLALKCIDLDRRDERPPAYKVADTLHRLLL